MCVGGGDKSNKDRPMPGGVPLPTGVGFAGGVPLVMGEWGDKKTPPIFQGDVGEGPTIFERHNLDRPDDWDNMNFRDRRDWYTANVDQTKWPRGNPFHIDQYLRGEFDRA